LAFLSKYHAVLIPIGVGLFVMVEPAARRRAKSVGPVLALAVAAVVSMPVLLWNYDHGWMSFTAFLHRGLAVRGVHPQDALKSIAGQALLLMPWTWALLVGVLVRGLTPGCRSPAERFLSLLAVGPLVLFTAASAVNGEWFQIHWPLIGYASLFPLAGAALASAVGRAAVWVRRLEVLSMASIAALVGGILLYAATPWAAPLSALVPRLAPSRFVARNFDLSGYEGLDEALRQRGLLGRPNLFVCAGNAMDCGRLAWVLRDRLLVLCAAPVDEGRSYPFLPRASGWPGADALLVSRDPDLARDLEFARPHFSRATAVGSVIVGRGAHRTTLRLHLLEGMSRPFASFSVPAGGWEIVGRD
jgi:hypothetical protein